MTLTHSDEDSAPGPLAEDRHFDLRPCSSRSGLAISHWTVTCYQYPARQTSSCGQSGDIWCRDFLTSEEVQLIAHFISTKDAKAKTGTGSGGCSRSHLRDLRQILHVPPLGT